MRRVEFPYIRRVISEAFTVPLLPSRSCLALPIALLCLGSALGGESGTGRIRFNRDVRPILSDACFECHGPDRNARQADLRLDDPASIFAERSGYRVVVPGQPAQSELHRRVTGAGGRSPMPPPERQRQLSEGEIELIRRWIAEGAEFEPHWSFVPPSRPAIPAVAQRDWPRNPIDHFVLSRLERAGLEPLPEADKRTLLRRVALDLTGLPPSPKETAAFLADDAPDAYERLIDRLLASPPYGERMALVWLDAARFADSGGYQGDILRTMWPWRDWVIEAYNANMPFDRFTVEQLAGDLLPHPTQDQLIATGFNRNHRINDEDGIIPEEFRVEYVADRVETTATVWMGLTIGCARCHDHKYDPFTQREFYRLFAYFNSIAEQGRGHGNSPPVLQLTTPAIDQRLAELNQQIEELTTAGASTGNMPGPAAEQVERLRKDRAALLASVPTMMIMRELEQPRQTFVLVRGAYNQPGESVIPGVPAVLPPLPQDAPPNRLALARWLVDPRHPLTARVAVNRYWQIYFGRGLVATPEDFGSQGESPSHPDLLDWLATEFIRTGWNVKSLQRLIVTSAAYRQSSAVSRDRHRRDPENRLISRGPRFRLPAELVRDQALAASGLLQHRIGGPSVRPYQPEGLWDDLASAHREYNQSTGPDLYRRSLYTFVRRTVPPPAMKILDMPNREVCAVRRSSTNTPLQALVLMNDPTFVEAARALAERAFSEAGAGLRRRLTLSFQLVLGRSPQKTELQRLSELLEYHLARFRDAPERAREFLTVGETAADATADPAELAAYAAVASVILNLDETVTKE